MRIKKIFVIFTILLMGFVLISCDEIKQIISDTAAPIIEGQINEVLKEQGLEEKFKLPDAKRYEGFGISKEENKVKFDIVVVEPKVTVDEYLHEMETTFNITIDQSLVDEVLSTGKLEINTDTRSYIGHYSDTKDENGHILTWNISFEMINK